MPVFEIRKARSHQKLSVVRADDVENALDVFAMQNGFWDFEECAQSLQSSRDQAKKALSVREVPEPAPRASQKIMAGTYYA